MTAACKLAKDCRQVSLRSQRLKVQKCSSCTSQEGCDVGSFLPLFAFATKGRPLTGEQAVNPLHLM